MDKGLQLSETTPTGGCVGNDSINYDESQKLNACSSMRQEAEDSPSEPEQHQEPSKRLKPNYYPPPIYYPSMMNVETMDSADEHIQEAWAELYKLGDDITKEEDDITLDFREPLRGSDDMLADAAT